MGQGDKNHDMNVIMTLLQVCHTVVYLLICAFYGDCTPSIHFDAIRAQYLVIILPKGVIYNFLK